MRSALPRLLPWIAVVWCAFSCIFLVGELHREVSDPGDSDYVALLDGGYILTTGSHCLYCPDVQRATEAQLLHEPPQQHSAYLQVYVSPPLSAWVIQPLTRIGLAQGVAVVALVSLACLGFAALWAWRWLRARLDAWRALLLFGVTLLYVGAESAIVQWDYVLLALTAVAFILVHRRRSFAAGLLLGLMLVKPQVVWLIPVLLLASRQWRTLLGFAAGGLVYAVTGLAIVGPLQLARWLPFTTSVHAADAWQSVGLPGALATVVGNGWWAGIASIALGAAVAVVAWRERARLRDPGTVIALGLMASLVCAPHVLWEDVILCAPGLLLYSRRHYWSAVGLAASLNAGFLIDGYVPVHGLHVLTVALAATFVAVAHDLVFSRPAGPERRPNRPYASFGPSPARFGREGAGAGT